MNNFRPVAVVLICLCLAAALASAQSGKRFLVYHDMEGLSGEDDWRQFNFRHKEQYAKGRELLTADINAVIAGLFDGGATVVHVVDAHGSGNPEPDVLLEKLDRRASMVFRDKPFRQYVDIVEPNTYDGIICVGMHAKTGSGGFASHTFTLGMDIIMNDMSITETELIGYSWGRVSVPVIMVTGDDRLANDLKTMPWIEFVTVKKATSASTVELFPVDEIHAKMRAAAKRSVGNLRNAKAMTLQTPIKAALRAVPPASLQVLDEIPGIQYSENTVTFMAENFGKAYDGVIALTRVATRAYSSVLTETVRKQTNGDQMMFDYSDNLAVRWLDFESGRWAPPQSQQSQQSSGTQRYHGAR